MAEEIHKNRSQQMSISVKLMGPMAMYEEIGSSNQFQSPLTHTFSP